MQMSLKSTDRIISHDITVVVIIYMTLRNAYSTVKGVTYFDPGWSAVRSRNDPLTPQLAISETDELYTWGFNGHGRLGHRTTENELIPMRVLHFRPGDRNSGVKVGANCVMINT